MTVTEKVAVFILCCYTKNMKLVVKNKLFSLGGASKVLDENKQDYLKVKGKLFTFTKKKFVQDLSGNT